MTQPTAGTSPNAKATDDAAAGGASSRATTGASSRGRRWDPFDPPVAADERLAAIALTGIRGLGAAGIARLLRGAADADDGTPDAEAPRLRPHALLAAAAPDASVRGGLLARAGALLDACAERGIRVDAVVDPSYPATLLDLEDPPPLLFSLGSRDLAARPTVALVGSRQATAYGRQVARDLATRLVAHGVCVVSGLALGIDGEAHAAALAAGGATIAVLGTGVDVPYPREHTALYHRIACDGLVLSEQPPGRPAHPGLFPRRNRIIAALADVVVVVEAGARSGAMHTAEAADRIHRKVGAVPGAIDVDSSRGANTLIRDGAQAITDFDDILGLLALSTRALAGQVRVSARPLGGRSPHDAARRAPPVAARAAGDLSITPAAVDPASAEGRLLGVLAHGPQGTDELIRACAMAPREVAMALANLSLDGAVVIDAAGMVQRVSRAALGRREQPSRRRPRVGSPGAR